MKTWFALLTALPLVAFAAAQEKIVTLGGDVTEIVYALTNEKGRTRAERANDKYYNDICNTPYAPLVKMADRMANMSYSIEKGSTMANVYRKELPHFIEAITKNNKNLPPKEMIEDLKKIVI